MYFYNHNEILFVNLLFSLMAKAARIILVPTENHKLKTVNGFPGLTGFDSIALCKYKHVVRWIISTLI